jgi:hypothetical protein
MGGGANLEELGGRVGRLAGGDLEEGGDEGVLLGGRRGNASHGGRRGGGPVLLSVFGRRVCVGWGLVGLVGEEWERSDGRWEVERKRAG